MSELQHALELIARGSDEILKRDELESRLAALGTKIGPAAMPKGPLPTQAKMRGVQRTVRRK